MIKELRFETSKGKFFMVENSPEVLKQVPYDLCDRIGLLSGLTEEQASEIVEIELAFEVDEETSETKRWEKSALDSLNSLIKSKGWYLDNPYKKPEHYDLWAKYGDFTQYGKSLTESVKKWQQAESQTLHNPVIFKIK